MRGVGLDSPAERCLDRESALDRVDKIIARSWQDREMRDGPARSATMYGAAPAASHEEQEGIEQRLLA